MTSYSFFSLWVVDAPIDRVWDVISKSEEYPQWWQYVSHTVKSDPGDEAGVGGGIRVTWMSALPYNLEFDTKITRIDKPRLIELTATGELAGAGRWELSDDGTATSVRYYWTVRTTKRWMDLAAPIARPAFAWNHGVIMRAGGEGLARRLNAPLLRNESFTGEGASPVAAVTSITSMAIVIGLLLRKLGGLRPSKSEPETVVSDV